MVNRIGWVDALRGMAVMLMVGYHLAWNLEWWYGIEGLQWWWVLGMGWGARLLFLGLVGVGLSLGEFREDFVSRSGWRGLRIFGLGMVVSGVTYVVMGREYYVRWGVLHLIGLGVMILPWIMVRVRKGWWYVATGSIAIVVGTKLGGICVEHEWWAWLGMGWCGMESVDYFPVLPWMGVVVWGIGVGRLMRKNLERIEINSDNQIVRGSAWLGRRSLGVYVVHQPMLLGALWLWSNL